MESILYSLFDEQIWEEFYQNREEKHHLTKKELKTLRHYIDSKQYLLLKEKVFDVSLNFDVPQKKVINKIKTGKKRVVYEFNKDEIWILKLLCWLLYRYDSKLNDACFSFRKKLNGYDALKKILHIKDLDNKYCLKVDIHNYFNSIPSNYLYDEIEKFIDDDDLLLAFLKKIVLLDQSIENEILIHENRGAMAGCPISPFFANIYLKSLDDLFIDQQIPYFRYSDDILIFANSLKELDEYKTELFHHIHKKGLEINDKKLNIYKPNEKWEFLGFCYDHGNIDLSDITKEKIKQKIKRKAKALYRWRSKNGVGFESSARVLIRKFNKKFYEDEDEKNFTWTRWFFPVLTTSNGLKEIDQYFVENIRYLYSGRHYKGNYKIEYADIKKLGYRSLVNEYYRYKKKAL